MALKLSKRAKRRHQFICPYCHKENFFSTEPHIEKEIPAKKDYAGYPWEQVAYRILIERACKGCGKTVTLDLGISRYSVYEEPFSVECSNEIWRLAEFKSETYDDYSIYRAVDPNDETKYYYYISPERGYPIFITEKVATELIKDHYETLHFIFCVHMERTH